MPRLLLLNGPPGIGKSTLARRYVQDRPLAFCLDIDGFRRLLGRWSEHERESGLLARAMAVEMARVHLEGGRDVVVPQFAAQVEFIEELRAVAAHAGAAFVEVVLMDSRLGAVARFEARRHDPEAAIHHHEAAQMVGGPAGLSRMYDRLEALLAARPGTVVVRTRSGEPDAAYRDLLTAIGDPPPETPTTGEPAPPSREQTPPSREQTPPSGEPEGAR